MKQWKTGLVILSILLVAVTGAVLPLCCHPDTKPDETYSFMSIPDYTIDSDRKPMTIPEKMELLRFGGQRISVLPDRMKRSENEIIAAVKDEFERYAEKGILSAGLRCVESTTWPTMVFSMETGEKFDFFWEVSLILKNDSQRMEMFCVVDDDTKKILTIWLYCKKQAILQEPVQDSVYRFAEAYFEGLGIMNAQEYHDKQPDSIVYKVPTEDGARILVEFDGGYGALSQSLGISFM